MGLGDKRAPAMCHCTSTELLISAVKEDTEGTLHPETPFSRLASHFRLIHNRRGFKDMSCRANKTSVPSSSSKNWATVLKRRASAEVNAAALHSSRNENKNITVEKQPVRKHQRACTSQRSCCHLSTLHHNLHRRHALACACRRGRGLVFHRQGLSPRRLSSGFPRQTCSSPPQSALAQRFQCPRVPVDTVWGTHLGRKWPQCGFSMVPLCRPLAAQTRWSLS